jgi:hypothetical protein
MSLRLWLNFLVSCRMKLENNEVELHLRNSHHSHSKDQISKDQSADSKLNRMLDNFLRDPASSLDRNKIQFNHQSSPVKETNFYVNPFTSNLDFHFDSILTFISLFLGNASLLLETDNESAISFHGNRILKCKLRCQEFTIVSAIISWLFLAWWGFLVRAGSGDCFYGSLLVFNGF